LILGKTGLGKTHLAIALGKRLCQEGHPALFLPINFLFEEIQAVKAAGIISTTFEVSSRPRF